MSCEWVLKRPELVPAKEKALKQFLENVTVFPFDESCAGEAAKIRVELEADGNPIGPVDTLIAGTARRNGYTIITDNVGEFSRVKGLNVE